MAGKKTPGKHRTHKPKQEGIDSFPPFDRRQVERQMADVVRFLQALDPDTPEEADAQLQKALASGDIPQFVPTTPLERAQEMVYDAMEATGSRRLTLARRALSISPDCADAYVLLAEATRDQQEARRLFEEGVKAGERALGPEAFQEAVGMFWGILETRPYMRARLGLAVTLWHLGEREAAIGHAKDILRLNPDDNQGIRYLLSGWLLAVGDDAGCTVLLDQFPEDWSAYWAYGRVLLTFRQVGAGKQADEVLKTALTQNKHVPRFLLGKAPLPKQRPPFYSMGDESEAVLYVADGAAAWRSDAAALAWLAEALPRVTRAR